jgi:bifunctional non-homologous end joining protein LigD
VPGPGFVAPMLASPGAMPRDDGRWAAEVKWDGFRVVIAVTRDRTVRAWTRNEKDALTRFPPLSGLAPLARDVVLDGEVVAFGTEGRPSFEALQQWPAGGGSLGYVAFDLVHLDGRDLTALTYDERRAALVGLGLEPSLGGAQVADAHEHPAQLLAATRDLGLEGIVCKLRESRYEPGRRSRAWLKTKNVRDTEVVVAGWKEGDGGRSGRIGSLLLGVHDVDGFVFAGHVGTGFTEKALHDLARTLAPLARDASPFDTPVPRADAKGAHWVEPVLVGTVAFTEWTIDGRLRHPSWKGLRDDKEAGGVTRAG